MLSIIKDAKYGRRVKPEGAPEYIAEYHVYIIEISFGYILVEEDNKTTYATSEREIITKTFYTEMEAVEAFQHRTSRLEELIASDKAVGCKEGVIDPAAVTEKTVEKREEILDFRKTFQSPVQGTSALVHKTEAGTIHIAIRRSNKTSLNHVCINDEQREEFFADCKRAKGYIAGKYVIKATTDPILYTKWSNLMRNEFIMQYPGGSKS